MEIRVDVKGISCHGSAPERGDNAIYIHANLHAAPVTPVDAAVGRLRGDHELDQMCIRDRAGAMYRSGRA